MGNSMTGLIVAIVLEQLTSGMGTSAYVAYMASLTNKKFTATQYALLSSCMGIPRVIIAAPAGWLAELVGGPCFFSDARWPRFQVYCFFLWWLVNTVGIRNNILSSCPVVVH